jgi:hypothetical protein
MMPQKVRSRARAHERPVPRELREFKLHVGAVFIS